MTSTTDAKHATARRIGPIYRTPSDHVAGLLTWLYNVLPRKYRQGQDEHGGELYAKPGALSNLEEEVSDLVVYHKTARDQLAALAREGKTAREAYEFLYNEPVG